MRLLLLLAALAVVGCGRTDKDRPVEVGHIYPPGGEVGDEERALRLAVEEWNRDAAKLPQGRKLKVRHAPGGARPEEWGAQATRLIALNKEAALIGGGRGAVAGRIGTALVGGEGHPVSPARRAGAAGARNLLAGGRSPGG